MGQVNMYLGGEPIRAHVLLQPQTRLPSSQNWLPAPFLLPAAAQNSPMLFCPKSPPPFFLFFLFFPVGSYLPGQAITCFPVSAVSSMAFLHQQHGVSCSWSHAWRGVPPHFSGAASSSNIPNTPWLLKGVYISIQ